MASLSDDEIEALRSLPAFQKALKTVTEIREAEERDAKAEWDAEHKYCPGTMNPKVTKKSVKCKRCGLKLRLSSFGVVDVSARVGALKRPHWNHVNGGNFLREDGLSGKAAAAADGDWYGSH